MGAVRLLLGAVLVLSRSFAQDDPHNVQELPTGLRDARAPTGFGLQVAAGYRRETEKADTFGFEPQISYGRSNWYGEITYLLGAGQSDRRNSGALRFLLFRQLNGENGGAPIFAVLASADAPVGVKSAGLDTHLQGNVSKTLGAGAAEHRLHLNAGWMHNAAPRGDERSNLYRIVAGYSRKIGPRWVMVADYLRHEQRERGQDLSLLELGFRVRIGNGMIMSVGGAAGIGSRPAKAQAVIGLEHSF